MHMSCLKFLAHQSCTYGVTCNLESHRLAELPGTHSGAKSSTIHQNTMKNTLIQLVQNSFDVDVHRVTKLPISTDVYL